MKLIIGILIGTIVTACVLYTPKDPSKYQIVVVDNYVEVYDYDRHVGNIMLDGSLQGIIVDDNE